MFPMCKSSGFKSVNFESKALLLSHLILRHWKGERIVEVWVVVRVWYGSGACGCGWNDEGDGNLGACEEEVHVRWCGHVCMGMVCVWCGRWVRWCGRVCMGVGEMRKRVMAMCGWEEGDGCVCVVCVGMGKWWKWEGCGSGKVVDGRRKKWVSYWWFNAWVLRVFWEKKWKKNPSLVWCLTNFITYFKYKFE